MPEAGVTSRKYADTTNGVGLFDGGRPERGHRHPYRTCWVISIEFPFVWGLLAAVLNFVPTIGSIVAVVPPTLFALAFGGPGTAALTLVGLGVIQFTMGNAVDPALQGRALQLSETVVLLSVVFWGWLWGSGARLSRCR